MIIHIEEYQYKHVSGEIQRVPVIRHWTYRWMAAVVLFLFKMINYKHVYRKDEYDRIEVRKIYDIRGIKTCRYETQWGQMYVGEFMWRIGKWII